MTADFIIEAEIKLGIIHPRITILSLFIHPHFIQNLVRDSFFCRTKKEDILRNMVACPYNGSQCGVLLSGYRHYSKYIIWSSVEERKSYRFRMMWRCANDERVILGDLSLKDCKREIYIFLYVLLLIYNKKLYPIVFISQIFENDKSLNVGNTQKHPFILDPSTLILALSLSLSFYSISSI